MKNFDKEKWLPHYRSNKGAVWIKCILSNDEQVFYDHFSGWVKLKARCESEGLCVVRLDLQYRSHDIQGFSAEDHPDCEGVYLIRSLLGEMGGACRQYYTTGFLKDGKIEKKMWLIPELIVEKETKDDISECFEEAIIYNGKKKKN